MDTTPGTTYYGDNEVSITLPGKSPAAIAYSPGPETNPYAKTVLNGPFNWTADASLFKAFPITERVNLRFNMDAFNVFNVQGENNPNATDGTQCVTPGGVAAPHITRRARCNSRCGCRSGAGSRIFRAPRSSLKGGVFFEETPLGIQASGYSNSGIVLSNRLVER